MASRNHRQREFRPDPREHEETGTPCKRQPPELCEGARLVTQDDGTSRREPARTPRAFCDPCRSRIITCLEEIPPAYERLAAKIGDPARAGKAVRVAPGSRVLLNGDIDALMRTMAAVLGGWAMRVRRVPGLELADPGLPPDSAEAVEDACAKVMARHPDPLLALGPKWTSRTFTYPAAGPPPPHVSTCRRCGHRITPGRKPGEGREPAWYLAEKIAGPLAACEHQPSGAIPDRPDVIPAWLLDAIGDHEIVRQGDGWLTVMEYLDGAVAGNEIFDLHWRARRILGETKDRPESLDGIPCRNCEAMGLERAEPPSDPSLPVNWSKCPECRDEMDREEFGQWADTYAQWARGAGIKECRRCGLAARAAAAEDRARLHAECCWGACSCSEGEHPRRPAAA